MAQPYFSIVIPTRNRGHLLQYALQSALEQTFEDFEVLVSDNFSDDNTGQVIQDLSDSRLRLVRTDRPLSMPAHWEFALAHARGQWITFLSSRSAVIPNFLAAVSAVIQQCKSRVLSWRWAAYFLPSWYDPALANFLEIPPFADGVRELTSEDTLRKLFRLQTPVEAPLMLNSFCHQSIVAGIKSALGKYFISPCPDYSSCLLTLSEVPNFVHIDRPLLIGGATLDSTGFSAMYNRGKSFQNFFAEFEDQEVFKHTPLKTPTVANSIAETILAVMAVSPERFRGYKLDLAEYFRNCYWQLAYLADNGIDTEKDRQQLYAVLHGQPFRVQLAVVHLIAVGILRKTARRLLRSVGLLDGFRKRRQLKRNRSLISGNERGFANILECARRLETICSGKDMVAGPHAIRGEVS